MSTSKYLSGYTECGRTRHFSSSVIREQPSYQTGNIGSELSPHMNLAHSPSFLLSRTASNKCVSILSKLLSANCPQDLLSITSRMTSREPDEQSIHVAFTFDRRLGLRFPQRA